MQPDLIPVLDHGFVRLIASMGSDLSVVRAARVSYDAAWRAGDNRESDVKLINYLWRHHHTTPFEAVTFTFEVKAPIFVFRQWHRHRTWSVNELSARYRELPEEFYLPKPEQVGVQAAKNKQGRDVFADAEIVSLRAKQIDVLRHTCENAFAQYRELLSQGWPRELARMVLPLNTYSHMFATVNLLNFMKFLSLRCDAHAQFEIRVYANALRELARTIVPVCIDAWETLTTFRGE